MSLQSEGDDDREGSGCVALLQASLDNQLQLGKAELARLNDEGFDGADLSAWIEGLADTGRALLELIIEAPEPLRSRIATLTPEALFYAHMIGSYSEPNYPRLVLDRAQRIRAVHANMPSDVDRARELIVRDTMMLAAATGDVNSTTPDKKLADIVNKGLVAAGFAKMADRTVAKRRLALFGPRRASTPRAPIAEPGGG